MRKLLRKYREKLGEKKKRKLEGAFEVANIQITGISKTEKRENGG